MWRVRIRGKRVDEMPRNLGGEVAEGRGGGNLPDQGRVRGSVSEGKWGEAAPPFGAGSSGEPLAWTLGPKLAGKLGSFRASITARVCDARGRMRRDLEESHFVADETVLPPGQLSQNTRVRLPRAPARQAGQLFSLKSQQVGSLEGRNPNEGRWNPPKASRGWGWRQGGSMGGPVGVDVGQWP